jgi:hypothetical protein
MNVRGSLRNIRIRLRDPRAQQPSDRTLLVLFSTHVQNLLTEANLRGRYWSVDETQVVVNGNVTDYPIGVDGFGKPIEVQATYPNGQPSHDVDFYTLGDLNFEPDSPYAAAWFDGYYAPGPNNRVAFYRKAGNIYLRIPANRVGATYNIIYQVGIYGSTLELDEELLFPEFYALAELRTAISALPHAEWSDDRAENREVRKELGLTLPADAADTYKLFRSYVATQTAGDQPTYRLLDSFDD